MAVSVFCFTEPLSSPSGIEEYSPSSACLTCHPHIFEQHGQSMHEKSFVNAVFQAQYFNELLPQIRHEPELLREAQSCSACHSPITFLKLKKHLSSREQVDPRMSGVTCDFCHTITGYKGENPGSGNYLSAPNPSKLGPLKYEATWHRAYSELHTKSEFCAICHNAFNHNGIEVKSTFTEWKSSRYAKEGIQCQDCHMNVQGFLTGGKPVYESGNAAAMPFREMPYREKLYTHQFPGAHSQTQITGALTLMIETERPAALPADEIIVHVLVDNSRTGHKLPSGSADLRLLWLDVKAYAGDKPLPALAASNRAMYDIAGKGAFDQEVLGNDVPAGSRIYRAIFLDKTGKQTLASYMAKSIVFDNRLNAAEVRKESYRIKIPEDAKNPLSLSVALKYLPYPSCFAVKLGIARPVAVTIAAAQKEIPLP